VRVPGAMARVGMGAAQTHATRRAHGSASAAMQGFGTRRRQGFDTVTARRAGCTTATVVPVVQWARGAADGEGEHGATMMSALRLRQVRECATTMVAVRHDEGGCACETVARRNAR
jgi:hypothetical protein